MRSVSSCLIFIQYCRWPCASPSMSVTFSPTASSASLSRLRAAFRFWSCGASQLGQTHSGSRPRSRFTTPQAERVLLLGYHWSASMSWVPASASALAGYPGPRQGAQSRFLASPGILALNALVRGCGAVWGCVQRETGFRTWGSCLVSAEHGCAARCRLDQSVRSGHDLAAFRGVFELHQDAGFEAGPFPPGGVILAPGIGSQGGDLRAAVLASVDERGRRAIIRASRAVSDCLKGPSWAASTLRADISAVLTDLGFPLA